MPDLSDDDLLIMYRDGDADAFDTLFDRHRVSVCSFARAMLREDGGAEDVLQETFLAVARTARTYAPRGRFRVWLMRIVRNRCLNRLQAERVRGAAITELALDIVDVPSGAPSPERHTVANESMAIVLAAIPTLPERQREALALYAFEQMSYRGIAEVLDAPINTVKTLIHRARAALAQALERASGEGSMAAASRIRFARCRTFSLSKCVRQSRRGRGAAT